MRQITEWITGNVQTVRGPMSALSWCERVAATIRADRTAPREATVQSKRAGPRSLAYAVFADPAPGLVHDRVTLTKGR